jgi:hypothetical protein
MAARRLPRVLVLLVPLWSAGAAAAEDAPSLEAYLRLRQALEREPAGAPREELERRVVGARETLLLEAARSSRVLATAERRPDHEAPGERHVVRLAARDGRVTVEALSGLRVPAPEWQRAEEVAMGAYLGLLRRLLDSPAMTPDFADQRFDPNAPGPRRAAAMHLAIGDEERRLQALYGEPYARLKEVVRWVLEFARTAPPVPPPHRAPRTGARP